MKDHKAKKYDIEHMPLICQAELEQKTEIVLHKAKEIGPLRILGEDGRENILMSWSDYWEKFGCLYAEEDAATLQEAFRKARDSE